MRCCVNSQPTYHVINMTHERKTLYMCDSCTQKSTSFFREMLGFLWQCFFVAAACLCWRLSDFNRGEKIIHSNPKKTTEFRILISIRSQFGAKFERRGHIRILICLKVNKRDHMKIGEVTYAGISEHKHKQHQLLRH